MYFIGLKHLRFTLNLYGAKLKNCPLFFYLSQKGYLLTVICDDDEIYFLWTSQFFCVICRKISLSIESWHIIFPAKMWPTAKLNYIGHPNKSRFSKHVVMTEKEIGVRSSRNGKYIKTMALVFVLYVIAFN